MSRFLLLYAGMTVVAALAARWGGCPSLFALPPDPGRLWGSLALALLLAGAIVGGGRVLEEVPWYRAMARFLKRLLTNPELLGPQLDAQKALVIAVYSAVGEEALFRGFLQAFLIGELGQALGQPGGVLPAVLGVLAAGGLFGLIHLPMARELIPWTVFAVLAGWAFGGLAAWSGSLLAPTLAHFLINWLNLKRLAELRLEPEPERG